MEPEKRQLPILDTSSKCWDAIYIFLLSSEMGTLVRIATVLSFLTAPVFAILNYRLVTSKYMPLEAQPRTILRWWSRIGLYSKRFTLLYLLSLMEQFVSLIFEKFQTRGDWNEARRSPNGFG